MLKRGTELLWQALMEDQCQQRIELLPGEDERWMQDFVDLNEQVWSQQKGPAAWQTSADEQIRRLVELGNKNDGA